MARQEHAPATGCWVGGDWVTPLPASRRGGKSACSTFSGPFSRALRSRSASEQYDDPVRLVHADQQLAQPDGDAEHPRTLRGREVDLQNAVPCPVHEPAASKSV